MTTSQVIFDRYADSIIGDHPDRFNAIEINGVRDNNAPDDAEGTFMEVDNVNPQFFSVYLQLIEGDIYSAGDFSEKAEAEKYAAELAALYGWPVTNCAA